MTAAPAAAGAPELEVGEDGWVPLARRVESPNADPRPPGSEIELLVIHCISLPPGGFGSGDVLRLFTNRLDPAAHPFYRRLDGLRVSAHFLIERDGTLTQCVGCRERAWHAGESSYRGRPRCNDFSIGIELEGSEFEPFTSSQYTVLAALARALARAFPIRAALGHAQIAPGRKTDPGPLFDWARFGRLSGLPAAALPAG
jgi:AmpD protein